MVKREKKLNKMDEGVENFSPISTWLNGRVNQKELSKFQIEFLVRKEMTDEYGKVHKGILCVYVQETIQTAIQDEHKNESFEMDCMQMSFISQAKLGDKIIISAKLEMHDNSWNQVECFVQCDRRLIARALCSIRKVS